MELGTSHNKLVREAVAARGDCPLGLLVALAYDKVVEVRIAVAANPGAARTVMEYLATDKAVDVLVALIGNRALPPDILESLSLHRKAPVRDAVATRMNSADEQPHAQDEYEHTPELRDFVEPGGVLDEPLPVVREESPLADAPAVREQAPVPAPPAVQAQSAATPDTVSFAPQQDPPFPIPVA